MESSCFRPSKKKFVTFEAPCESVGSMLPRQVNATSDLIVLAEPEQGEDCEVGGGVPLE